MTSPLILFVYLTAAGQAPGGQGQVAAELSLQRSRIADACTGGAKALYKCPIEFLTDHPIHMAIGSLAPQNGFAFGPAYVTHFYNADRDISINADVVGTPSGAWRAGVYFKLVLTPVAGTGVVPIGPSGPPAEDGIVIHPYPIIDAYAQTMSLHTVFFFGLGPESAKADQTAFGLRHTIVGGRVVYPLFNKGRLSALNLAAVGELNGRFVDLRPSDAQPIPDITTKYDETTAPGLAAQPGVLQLGEGVRLLPAALNNRLRLTYRFTAEQFIAASPSVSSTSSVQGYSFRRWTADLGHEFSFYHTVLPPATRDTHGPNDCSAALGGSPCPPPSPSRNRYGGVGFRLYASTSTVSSGNAVPFYFQQTLGGSDVNGTRWLSGYQDYRFRGPGVFALSETVEHYIYGMVGLSLIAEQGTVSAPGEGLKLNGLKHSVSAGATLRAGGLPMASIMYGWGPEGHRVIAVVNTSLLGGSSRPSLQ
jgi:hypothetical protein